MQTPWRNHSTNGSGDEVHCIHADVGARNGDGAEPVAQQVAVATALQGRARAHVFENVVVKGDVANGGVAVAVTCGSTVTITLIGVPGQPLSVGVME